MAIVSIRVRTPRPDIRFWEEWALFLRPFDLEIGRRRAGELRRETLDFEAAPEPHVAAESHRARRR